MVRRELEEKFVLAPLSEVENTVTCAKAEYHGERALWSRETQPMVARKYGDREGLGLHGSWHTLAGVFFSVYFTLFLKELRNSLACKGTGQRPVSATSPPIHHLSSGLQGSGMPADDC